MEADIQNPSQGYRFCVGVHETNIAEWNKKRKLQSDPLDLLRPKHKCWAGSYSSEHALMFDENPALESMQIYVLKGRMDADSSEPESTKDSNSFTEDSITAMSVNEEGKCVANSAKHTYMRGLQLLWLVGMAILLDIITALYVYLQLRRDSQVKRMHLLTECNPSYHYADLQALKNLEEQILLLENNRDCMYQEYAKDSTDESKDMEFEYLFSKGENHNMYVLSSGRWNVNQEAQSNTRPPPTIDQEFE